MTAPAAQLFCAVASHGLPSALAMPARPLDPQAWSELVAHTRWQRCTHLLALSVTSGALPGTDEQISDAIQADEEAIATALRLEAALLDVAATLDRAQITYRVLKGPAVAHLDYPDPVWRSFGDIDLLIRPDDLDDAVDVLKAQGFARRYPEPRDGFDRRFTKSIGMTGPRGEEIDLHRTLAVGGFGQRIIVSMLWNAPPGTFELGDRTFAALGPEERFLHACYHAVLGNVPPRLSPQRDVAQMLVHGKLAADRVRILAAGWQGEAVVARAITTAINTLQLQTSHELAAWADRFTAPRRQRRELARATSTGYSYPAQTFDALRALHGPRERLAYVSALTFPRRSYLDGRHSGLAGRVRHALSDVRHVRSHQPGDQP